VAAGVLVGVIACGIKTVWLQGNQYRCGYVYDLRVHEDYQRLGLGRRLSEEIENRCGKQGVDFLYLTVNSDNAKAKTFYQKQGFVHASHRNPFVVMLTEKVTGPTCNVSQFAIEDALPAFEKAHGTKDMTPIPLKSILSSPLFECAFVAEDGASAAGLCLWDSGSFTHPQVERFFLPVQWYRYNITKCGFVCLALGLLALDWRALLSLWKQGAWISFGCCSILTVVLTWSVYKFVSFMRFASDWVYGVKMKSRARIFAPFAYGPKAEELLSGLVAHARNHAFNRGYFMLIGNLDKSDPFRSTYPKESFQTEFFLKPLVTKVIPKAFCVDSFHDPRDI